MKACGFVTVLLSSITRRTYTGVRWANVTFSNALAEFRLCGCHSTETFATPAVEEFVYRGTCGTMTIVEPESRITRSDAPSAARAFCALTVTGSRLARNRTMHDLSEWQPGSPTNS